MPFLIFILLEQYLWIKFKSKHQLRNIDTFRQELFVFRSKLRIAVDVCCSRMTCFEIQIGIRRRVLFVMVMIELFLRISFRFQRHL